MVTKEKETYTYADYAKLPEGAPYQLIGGMLVKSPSPVPYHQGLAGKFYEHFLPLQKKGLGRVYFSPIDVYLSETETYQPDVIFIKKERESIIGEKKIEGPPDIVVEILSPSTAYYDLRHKMKAYETFGVSEYWIVDPPEKCVEVYVNGEHGFSLKGKAERSGLLVSSLFPELTVQVEELFSV